jgi:hypothetical protein
MKSIFNKEDNLALQARIQALQPNRNALWGKMNVSQMLSHCQAPMEMAFGKLTLQSNFFMRIVGKIFKNKILNGQGFKKHSPTVKEFIRNDKNTDFEKNKMILLESLSHFLAAGELAIVNKKHPFFGTMSTEEWDKLQYMHLNHHLKQFGV